MTPYNKLSKKAKALRDRERRNTWDCKPVMKIIPNKKHYDRRKQYE